MSAEALIQKMTDTDDQSSLCVVLRPGERGLEVALVADEKGRWSIPGGHAQGNESRADACKREVKEETGLDIEVHPLFLAHHSARDLPVTLFYAIVGGDAELTPGGGDVTKAEWTPVTSLGSLNGTDRLAIATAANLVHAPQTLVDEAVEQAEADGYPVANVAAPPELVPGIYLRLTGESAPVYAQKLSEASDKPVAVVKAELCESSQDALARAHRCRQLTPTMEALLQVSDALWRYEDKIAPKLRAGQVVVETGTTINTAALVERGIEQDLLDNLLARLPVPTLTLDVGAEFHAETCKALQDALEQSNDDVDPKTYIDNLSARDVAVPNKLEFVRTTPDLIDPIVRCPKCHYEGNLMDDFSYLAAGLNGIVAGDPDDLDCYECRCGAKLEYRHLDEMPVNKCDHCGAMYSYKQSGEHGINCNHEPV